MLAISVVCIHVGGLNRVPPLKLLALGKTKKRFDQLVSFVFFLAKILSCIISVLCPILVVK